MRERPTQHLAAMGAVMLLGIVLMVAHLPPAHGEPPAADKAAGTDISKMLQDAMPAVVNISTTRKIASPEGAMGGPGQGEPLFEDPFFREFFGDLFRQWGLPPDLRERSLGSGVIVDPSGLIVTNYHVIAKAEQIRVLLADEREFQAKVIGGDPNTDIAVIKIDAQSLPTLSWGDSKKLRVGDQVYAIGNPFGLNRTVTGGIVSAVGRADVGIADYEDFIQTDAAINPGNSGGALVDNTGKLMGINTAIFSETGGYMGIGFAVPSNMAQPVMQSLIKQGRVVRGYLGIGIQEVTPALARRFGLEEPQGVVVTQVTEGSPAQRAGIRTGDVIIAYQGDEIRSPGELRNRVAATPVGKQAEVTLIRDGKTLTPAVSIAEQPRERKAVGTPRPGQEQQTTPLGLQVAELTDAIRQQLNLERDTQGVVVANVEPGSAAAQAGLRPGDVIVQVNRKAVTGIDDFRQQLERVDPKEDPLFLVNRRGARQYVVVERG